MVKQNIENASSTSTRVSGSNGSNHLLHTKREFLTLPEKCTLSCLSTTCNFDKRVLINKLLHLSRKKIVVKKNHCDQSVFVGVKMHVWIVLICHKQKPFRGICIIIINL